MRGSDGVPSRRPLVAVAAIITALAAGCSPAAPPPAPTGTAAPAPAPPPAQQGIQSLEPRVPEAQSGLVAAPPVGGTKTPFPDFAFLPTPEKYTGPVFKLSQDSPATPPPA